MIRGVVLPYSRAGIAAALILGLAARSVRRSRSPR